MSSAGVRAACLSCGVADYLTGSRCTECHRARERVQQRGRKRVRVGRTDRVGSTNTQWRKLSRTARQLQPWCSDCLRSAAQLAEHEQLETDHLPSAWARSIEGKAVRLEDVDVTCSSCNVKRGPSGPGSKRWAQWEESK